MERIEMFRTMIYDRIEPLTPIKAPTVVNSGLSSMKPGKMTFKFHNTVQTVGLNSPSATRAKPEYAFNTVMTTAMFDCQLGQNDEWVVAHACQLRLLRQWS
jgi:hypothetical protein